MSPPAPKNPNAELEARRTAAEIAKLEADAAKATADARAAEAKVAADARTAEAAAQKQIAQDEQSAAAARRAQLSAMIPDLSAVKGSTVEVKDGPALYGSVLTFGALAKVAESIAEKVLETATPPSKVLITADSDLASVDAVYRDVAAGLEELAAAAQSLLPSPAGARARMIPAAAIADGVAAIAGAVPAALSLLSVHRTLSTAPVTVSDLAAVAAVAGALKAAAKAPPITIIHDDFRLVPDGGVYKSCKDLNLMRQQLLKARAGLGASEATSEEGVRRGQIDTIVTAIDAFIAAIRVVPAGGRRSALATAALFELLHAPAGGGTKPFSHVLLIKGQPGQSQQLIEDRPFWSSDRFSTIVDISVTFMLLDVAGSDIVAAGSMTGTATAYGKIGEKAQVGVQIGQVKG